MSEQLEKALIAGLKAFLIAFENKTQGQKFDFPVAKSALGHSNGVPICNIHGKKLLLSKTPKNPEVPYYCPTKDEETGKWCTTKAGRG